MNKLESPSLELIKRQQVALERIELILNRMYQITCLSASSDHDTLDRKALQEELEYLKSEIDNTIEELKEPQL